MLREALLQLMSEQSLPADLCVVITRTGTRRAIQKEIRVPTDRRSVSLVLGDEIPEDPSWDLLWRKLRTGKWEVTSLFR